MPLRVLFLVGSPTSDFFCDLSRLYAADCLASTADPALYEFHVAYVTPDGRWRFPADLGRRSIDAACTVPVTEAVRHITGLDVDVAVPQMFCPSGMTHYRSLLELLQIPYLGNTPDVMALAMDKGKTRAIVAAAGIDVPEGELLRSGERPSIGPPVVVKPVDADNSIGVTLVRHPDGFDEALHGALAHASGALVERYIELGREVRCGIVVRDGELVCLPLEEYNVDGATKPIRDHEDKLARDGHGELKLVAKDSSRSWIVDVDDPLTERVWDVARRAHVALGCRHHSLFDLRIDPDGRPWFLEASLYCSFARQSVICAMAGASGIDAGELFGMALRNVVS